MAENFFYVSCEVRVEDRGFAGFVFVRLRKGDALRDTATERLGGVKHSDGVIVILDDNFRARPYSC